MKFIHKYALLFFGVLTSISARSQNTFQQELGFNLASLAVKNNDYVLPSVFYRYGSGKYQLRIQLSLDGSLIKSDKETSLLNGNSGSSFRTDTALNYKPGRDIKYGFQIGIQKNKSLKNEKFQWYYGLDIYFIQSKYELKGEGKVITGSGSNLNEITLKSEISRNLNILGIGMPLGLTYLLGERGFISAECKFVLALREDQTKNYSSNLRVINGSETFLEMKNSNSIRAFDIKLMPLTGLTAGLKF
ncbi:MAG: hypothetical protein H6605_09060 [Flavobacteriales bacterium]|nr:hypothetical protein [Flavobacteriales bacterium]